MHASEIDESLGRYFRTEEEERLVVWVGRASKRCPLFFTSIVPAQGLLVILLQSSPWASAKLANAF